MKIIRLTILLLITGLAAMRAGAGQTGTVNELLAASEAPPGVVFEIVSSDDDLLAQLIPALRADIQRLRARFPGLPVAVVSHGAEQFALTSDNRNDKPELHAIVEQISTNEDVNVHVCGTYASWFGVDPGDFPDYVDVSPTGPAQINDYRALDYVLVILP